ncbi:unnamed protein product [Durusdinium trenchii]|uniref:Uncharacterized protein n=1 Tax=Durusdinium trenchii TaxID=1381693 RepID=A0ABP0S650_9DINO
MAGIRKISLERTSTDNSVGLCPKYKKLESGARRCTWTSAPLTSRCPTRGAVPARHPCATSDQHTCCLVCPFWSSALCLSQRRLSELVFWAASLSTGETGLQLVLPPLGDLETIDQSVGSPWRVHIETEECRSDVSCASDNSASLWRFHPRYLRALEGFDRHQWAQGTVQGAIRLLLLLQPTPTVKASEARGWAVQAILQDLQKCTEWWLVMENRQALLILVRGPLGSDVAEHLCQVWQSSCTVVQLVDLPEDLDLARQMLTDTVGEAMQTSRCVLILPFDFYEEVDDARQGTLLETPHWESWAITLAHWMAQRSREKLVVHVALGHDFARSTDDLAMVVCTANSLPSDREKRHSRCSKPVLVHGLKYMEDESFVQTGLVTLNQYGGFGHGTAFQNTELEDFGSQAFWGVLGSGPLRVQPLFSYLHSHERSFTDLKNFGQYIVQHHTLPILTQQRLILSMAGSGQSYVRLWLELLSGRPTPALEGFYAQRGNSLVECFPGSMPQVNGQMAPIAWVAHSGFEARKVAPFASLTSLVVLLRDYAQLWLRQKRSARAEPMNDFVGEYLGNLDPVPRVKAAGGTTLVLYFDELFGSESLPLPQSLLDLLSLGSPDLEQMTSLRSSISQLSLTCDEFESRPDCAAPCRNLKVAYAKSKHPQPSAPREVSPEDLPEIYQLEELLCATNPTHVNTFLLQKRWGSGFLQGCVDGAASFFPRP